MNHSKHVALRLSTVLSIVQLIVNANTREIGTTGSEMTRVCLHYSNSSPLVFNSCTHITSHVHCTTTTYKKKAHISTVSNPTTEKVPCKNKLPHKREDRNPNPRWNPREQRTQR